MAYMFFHHSGAWMYQESQAYNLKSLRHTKKIVYKNFQFFSP